MTDKTDAWMPLWIGSYLADTQHLERGEHGAYFLLMMAYWRNQGPLPDDDKRLSSITKSTPKEWKTLRTTMAEFFKVGDGVWWHKRIEAELAGSKERSKKAASKAKAAAEARWGHEKKDSTSNAPSMLQALLVDVLDECPTPLPIKYQGSKDPLSSSTPTDQPGPADDAGDKPPPCPHEKLIDLFGQHLPNLPQPRKSLWAKSKNASALRNRWLWVMTECHESGSRKGSRIATTEGDGLDWFGKFFSYVNDSDFLTGRNGKFTGCDLGWLMTLDNFSKTLQGNYHAVKAAA